MTSQVTMPAASIAIRTNIRSNIDKGKPSEENRFMIDNRRLDTTVVLNAKGRATFCGKIWLNACWKACLARAIALGVNEKISATVANGSADGWDTYRTASTRSHTFPLCPHLSSQFIHPTIYTTPSLRLPSLNRAPCGGLSRLSTSCSTFSLVRSAAIRSSNSFSFSVFLPPSVAAA